MFELDHALAQGIVDRAMAILPCNVNVMDSQGLILGSGEPGRVNTRHEGAQLVLANKRVVEINAQSALCLKGVQPGVNVPLMHDGCLIGVLGLTGDPAALRTYADLLRMTAEMIVSHRQREAEQPWRGQRSHEVLALLLGEGEYPSRVLDEATQLGLKPELNRTPVLLELAAGQSATQAGDWLAARTPDSWCLALSPQTLLWCCPTQGIADPHTVLQRVKAQGWPLVRMAVGLPVSGVDKVRKAIPRVKALAAYGRAVLPDESLLLLGRYRIPAMLWAHRKDDAIEELLAVLHKVQAKDSSGQLMQTLRCWFDHSGQIQPCADALGLHRNTLRYRMDRIADATGLDLARLDDMVALYLAVQLAPHGSHKANEQNPMPLLVRGAKAQ